MAAPVQVLAYVPRKDLVKTGIYLALATAVMLYIVWYLVSHPDGIFGARRSGAAWGACGLFFFGLYPWLFIQWSHGPRRRQIWLEGDRLFFYGDDELPISSINGISVGKHDVGVPQIAFALNNGTEKKIIVHGLSPSPEALAAKLRVICGLSPRPEAEKPREA